MSVKLSPLNSAMSFLKPSGSTFCYLSEMGIHCYAHILSSVTIAFVGVWLGVIGDRGSSLHSADS